MDHTLLNIKGISEEVTAKIVYVTIIDRIKKKFPFLIKPLEKIEADLPFSLWVPIVSELQIVHDFIGKVELNNDEKQVQIAYRYYNKIS